MAWHSLSICDIDLHYCPNNCRNPHMELHYALIRNYSTAMNNHHMSIHMELKIYKYNYFLLFK